jgi:UMF1 family MFS transporter
LRLFTQAESFGLETTDAVRISLCSAGVWWAIFTILPLITIKSRRPLQSLPKGENYIGFGFKQLVHTIKTAKNYPKTLLFLCAYMLYNDGVQSVITISSEFGQEEIGLGLSTLTSVILMVQFVAFGGSLLFKYISNKVGSKNAIMISLVIWTSAVLFAYIFLKTEFHFYILGFVIAIVLGGTQALSRSLYSQLIPTGSEAEYFSLYEVSERGTSWLGPFVFGLSLQLTNSYRTAILSLIVFFVLGFILLAMLKLPKNRAEWDPNAREVNKL